jgi:hypothetical protein
VAVPEFVFLRATLLPTLVLAVAAADAAVSRNPYFGVELRPVKTATFEQLLAPFILADDGAAIRHAVGVQNSSLSEIAAAEIDRDVNRLDPSTRAQWAEGYLRDKPRR